MSALKRKIQRALAANGVAGVGRAAAAVESVARDAMREMEAENAQLRADLDAGFAESDHLSAKYYRRMRDAERRAGAEVVKDSAHTLHLSTELETRFAHLLYEDGTGADKLDTSIYREQWVRKARLMLRKLAAGQEGEAA